MSTDILDSKAKQGNCTCHTSKHKRPLPRCLRQSIPGFFSSSICIMHKFKRDKLKWLHWKKEFHKLSVTVCILTTLMHIRHHNSGQPLWLAPLWDRFHQEFKKQVPSYHTLIISANGSSGKSGSSPSNAYNTRNQIRGYLPALKSALKMKSAKVRA